MVRWQHVWVVDNLVDVVQSTLTSLRDILNIGRQALITLALVASVGEPSRFVTHHRALLVLLRGAITVVAGGGG